MWHQHLCQIGCLTAFLVLLHATLLKRAKLPAELQVSIAGQTYPVYERLGSILSSKVTGEFMGGFLCLLYWSAAYCLSIFPPKLTLSKHRLYMGISTVLWHLLIQPYLFGSLFHSLYVFCKVIEEIGSLRNNVEVFWVKLLTKIKRGAISERLLTRIIEHLDGLQREYRCCGAFALKDWLGVSRSHNETRELLFRTPDGYYPWHNVPIFVPPGCCDPHRTIYCTEEFTKNGAIKLIGISTRAYEKVLPVHTTGCVEAMTVQLNNELTKTLCMLFVIDIIVHVFQASSCFFAYHLQRPPKPKSMRANSIISNDNTGNNSNHVPVKPAVRSYRIFKSAYGYISNERLLQVCQNINLFGRVASIQNTFSKVKADWLENGMHIGWILRDRENQYATYLQRMKWKTTYRPGEIEWSKWRQFLRKHCPLIEAVIYADGNVLQEIDGNTLYRSLTICLVRIVCFMFMGYIVSNSLVSAFVPDEPAKKNTLAEEGSTAAAIQRDTAAVLRDVATLASLFIRIVVIAASVISKRFRCLLLLLLPSLGLTVGQSYLGAELLHTTLTGPAITIERNLGAAASTLRCLMILSYNMTKDAKRMYRESQLDIELEKARDYFEDVKEKSVALNSALETYKESAKSLMDEIAKSQVFAKRAEDDLKGTNTVGNESTAETRKADENLRKKLSGLASKLNAKDANMTKKMAEVSKKKMKKLLGNMKSGAATFANLSARIEAGAKIETSIRRRLLATCMVFHNTRGRICTQSSVRACGRLQKVLSLVFALPILIKDRCVRQVSEGVACPAGPMVEAAVEECGSSVAGFGVGPGFGSMFIQSMDSMKRLSENFHMVINSKLMKPPKFVEWARGKKGAVVSVTKRLQEAAKILFSFSLILSSLLKLLALLVFRKAAKYITNYLRDPSFDNIYIGQAFEAIDSRRLKEGRETLLPLKSFEKKKIFWRRKSYTRAELAKAFITMFKAFGLGMVLLVIFSIDYYMAQMIGLLDIATSGELRVGQKTNVSGTENQSDKIPAADMNPATIPPEVRGSGIFHDLIHRTVSVVSKISKIKLNYELNVCSPKVQYTDIFYRERFAVIWTVMLLVGLASGYLLRIRHTIMDFFYPLRQRRRAVHLYNTLLVNRRRHMTVCRNLIIHQARQGRLQFEAQERSRRWMLHSLSPFLAKLVGKNKAQCLLCTDKFKIGKQLYICPYDDTALCSSCARSLFKEENVCVVCLDRQPANLFERHREIQMLKRKIAYGM